MTPPRMKAREMKNTAERTKYALFTGAAGGLASACIGVLLEKYPEWRVFAADKDGEKLRELAGKCGERVIPVVTDVTSDAGCADCLRIVKEHTGGLDAVVNAAGIHTMASLVESDAAAVTEKLAAVNLFGMMRINRIFFPLVKAARGRIIDFSSECGFEKAQPFNTPYAVTKYGVEAYTDGLRRELNFLGIKVIKIQPGSFGTGLLDQAQRGFDDLRAGTLYYGEVLDALGPLMKGAMSHPHDAKVLAKTVVRAMTSRRPRLRYRVKNTWYLRLIDPLPDRLQDLAYRKAAEIGCRKKKAETGVNPAETGRRRT